MPISLAAATAATIAVGKLARETKDILDIGKAAYHSLDSAIKRKKISKDKKLSTYIYIRIIHKNT